MPQDFDDEIPDSVLLQAIREYEAECELLEAVRKFEAECESLRQAQRVQRDLSEELDILIANGIAAQDHDALLKSMHMQRGKPQKKYYDSEPWQMLQSADRNLRKGSLYIVEELAPGTDKNTTYMEWKPEE